MALNKSNKSTPSSRSGYFCELTASTGKQNNFLFPVRIRVTPNNTVGSYSDGKKNHTKILQPVLIKDLLQSNQKERQHTKILSVSTQKKKISSQRSLQPYSGRQSYYKPKKEVDESNFYNRKSCEGNKVRRQLYQSLDYAQKFVFDGKDNTNKDIKLGKDIIQDSEEQIVHSNLIQNKNRQSFILPLNTIKNSFIQKSISNPIFVNKKSVLSNTSSVNKQIKRTSSITEIKKLKNSTQRNIYTERQDEENTELDFSPLEFNKHNKNESCLTMRDNFTMISPFIDKVEPVNKNLSTIREFDKKLYINNSSNSKSEVKHSHNIDNIDLSNLGIQNLSINNPDICLEKEIVFNETVPNTQLNLINVNDLDCNSFIKLKLFLEQSIQACENQTLKLKQALNFVNNILINVMRKDVQLNDNLDINEKFNVSNTLINKNTSSNITDIIDKSLENKNITDNTSTLITCTEKSNLKIEKNISSSKILINNEELSIVKKNTIEVVIDEARLSTIGETSCEVDEINKEDDSENKENNDLTNIICSNSPISLPNRSIEDSFTLLENELNVKHTILPSKSLPASPTQYCKNPAIAKQWDKKVERPLKEYMELKMNGTFLVTPDVKRFQSCLESTDTPHSRKSLSRKIFMELCDLYAESPESN